MATTNRRKRHRILALIAAGAMALVVVLLIIIVVVILRKPEGPTGVPPTGVPPTAISPTKKPRPEFQDASCPDVQMISVPGTWESSPQLDPFNPTQFPIALLLNVTNPIRGQFGNDRLEVFTVPYTAQFHNPFSQDGQMTYDDSRAEGFHATVKAMTEMNERCPLTSYVIAGFSQGAVIAGDIASDIGNGRGPVDEDLVLGVTLIADGRRQTGVGVDVGPNPPGQGAEITLRDVPMLDGMGLAMTGPRPGGFGALNDRVNEICAPGDLICSAPPEAFNIMNLPKTIDILLGGAGQPIHAMYATTQFWSLDGLSATQWTQRWAQETIDNAPQPKHG
ncbi:cutinase [Mycobacterium sp. 852002-51152_SCH6134967]|uniref:carboxylesterase Culp6 n=1 Tax=Mycobacterium sp. 852002-51152_SCH6134967 TaxID=1834096 RepID=UPI0007FB8D28|nr:cutinase family protein [Mycobacterium sp. 852002-51152_SCH6134967]OBF89731.1 cutinase [Mycobacterium sp. 852002-51152_SCH6134967]